MTFEELQSEAKRQGYRLTKIPDYQCTCIVPYPNIAHKTYGGRWKCVDDYEPIECTNYRGTYTRCRRKVLK